MSRFEGRTIVVTGAGSGIGAEMVLAFMSEGGRVFGADLDPGGIPDGCVANPRRRLRSG